MSNFPMRLVPKLTLSLFGLAGALLFGLFGGCATSPPQSSYQPRSATDVAWPEADSLEALGWQADRLPTVRREVDSSQAAAFLVLTEGQVVMKYGNLSRNFRAHSMRKSFLSALYGIATDQGEIDTSATLGELGITADPPLTEQEKTARIADLLKARSGVYLPAASEVGGMKRWRPDRGEYPPGTNWYYQNWDFNALGTIYRQETGRDIFEAFQEQIGRPLGMQDFQPDTCWYKKEDASVHESYKFRISARDLARFGQMYLREGAYENKQIVPASWVQRSTQAISQTEVSDGFKWWVAQTFFNAGFDGALSGFGLMWWVATEEDGAPLPAGTFTAAGYCGQYVTVFPSMETVVVHRVNTDLDEEEASIDPCIKNDEYNRLLAKLLQARIQ